MLLGVGLIDCVCGGGSQLFSVACCLLAALGIQDGLNSLVYECEGAALSFLCSWQAVE